jgi:hypothetical protein
MREINMRRRAYVNLITWHKKVRRKCILIGREGQDQQSQGTHTRGMFGGGNSMQKAYERVGGTSWSAATRAPLKQVGTGIQL